MIQRWERPGAQCEESLSCEHEISFNQDGRLLCACHIDPGGVPRDLLTEAIRLAGLESEAFEVDTSGRIHLAQEDMNGGQ